MVPAHGEHLERAAAEERIRQSLEFVATVDAFVAEYLDTHAEVRLGALAAEIGTRLGSFGGVNLQTVSIARAHLDHQVRTGAAVPVWRRPSTEEQP